VSILVTICKLQAIGGITNNSNWMKIFHVIWIGVFLELGITRWGCDSGWSEKNMPDIQNEFFRLDEFRKDNIVPPVK
jgi:hypothetical protein